MDAVCTPAPPRHAILQQRWFVVGLVLFFVVCSFKYGEKILDSERDNRSAFLRWREQIQELDDGVNIWEKFNYPNPPVMVLLLKPLVPLPPLVGSMAWYYLKVVMALAAVWLARAPGSHVAVDLSVSRNMQLRCGDGGPDTDVARVVADHQRINGSAAQVRLKSERAR